MIQYQDYTSMKKMFTVRAVESLICIIFKKGDLEMTHCAEESRPL